MANKHSSKKGGGFRFDNMSPKQKQAAIVLACCVAAVIITASVVGIVVSNALRGKAPDSSGSSSSSSSSSDGYDNSKFQVDETSPAVLAETADAGKEYLEQTVFEGDSNTVRFNQYNLLTLDQFVGKEGLGVQGVTTDACVYFKGDSTAYTIPKALAKMKPRRIIMTFGTNNADGNTTSDDFVAACRSAIKAIQEAYPYCDIIINAIPPIGKNLEAGYDLEMEIIDELEHGKRNLYTGSIGYLTLDGSCDFNIVIRTALHKNGKYHLGVGGGITAESDLEFEYEETLQKAKAILDALQ